MSSASCSPSLSLSVNSVDTDRKDEETVIVSSDQNVGKKDHCLHMGKGSGQPTASTSINMEKDNANKIDWNNEATTATSRNTYNGTVTSDTNDSLEVELLDSLIKIKREPSSLSNYSTPEEESYSNNDVICLGTLGEVLTQSKQLLSLDDARVKQQFKKLTKMKSSMRTSLDPLENEILKLMTKADRGPFQPTQLPQKRGRGRPRKITSVQTTVDSTVVRSHASNKAREKANKSVQSPGSRVREQRTPLPSPTSSVSLTPPFLSPQPSRLTPHPLSETPPHSTSPPLLIPLPSTSPPLLIPLPSTSPPLLIPPHSTSPPLLIPPHSTSPPLLIPPHSTSPPLLIPPPSTSPPLLIPPPLCPPSSTPIPSPSILFSPLPPSPSAPLSKSSPSAMAPPSPSTPTSYMAQLPSISTSVQPSAPSPSPNLSNRSSDSLSPSKLPNPTSPPLSFPTSISPHSHPPPPPFSPPSASIGSLSVNPSESKNKMQRKEDLEEQWQQLLQAPPLPSYPPPPLPPLPPTPSSPPLPSSPPISPLYSSLSGCSSPSTSSLSGSPSPPPSSSPRPASSTVPVSTPPIPSSASISQLYESGKTQQVVRQQWQQLLQLRLPLHQTQRCPNSLPPPVPSSLPPFSSSSSHSSSLSPRSPSSTPSYLAPHKKGPPLVRFQGPQIGSASRSTNTDLTFELKSIRKLYRRPMHDISLRASACNSKTNSCEPGKTKYQESSGQQFQQIIQPMQSLLPRRPPSILTSLPSPSPLSLLTPPSLPSSASPSPPAPSSPPDVPLSLDLLRPQKSDEGLLPTQCSAPCLNSVEPTNSPEGRKPTQDNIRTNAFNFKMYPAVLQRSQRKQHQEHHRQVLQHAPPAARMTTPSLDPAQQQEHVKGFSPDRRLTSDWSPVQETRVQLLKEKRPQESVTQSSSCFSLYEPEELQGIQAWGQKPEKVLSLVDYQFQQESTEGQACGWNSIFDFPEPQNSIRVSHGRKTAQDVMQTTVATEQINETKGLDVDETRTSKNQQLEHQQGNNQEAVNPKRRKTSFEAESLERQRETVVQTAFQNTSVKIFERRPLQASLIRSSSSDGVVGLNEPEKLPRNKAEDHVHKEKNNPPFPVHEHLQGRVSGRFPYRCSNIYMTAVPDRGSPSDASTSAQCTDVRVVSELEGHPCEPRQRKDEQEQQQQQREPRSPPEISPVVDLADSPEIVDCHFLGGCFTPVITRDSETSRFLGARNSGNDIGNQTISSDSRSYLFQRSQFMEHQRQTGVTPLLVDLTGSPRSDDGGSPASCTILTSDEDEPSVSNGRMPCRDVVRSSANSPGLHSDSIQECEQDVQELPRRVVESPSLVVRQRRSSTFISALIECSPDGRKSGEEIIIESGDSDVEMCVYESAPPQQTAEKKLQQLREESQPSQRGLGCPEMLQPHITQSQKNVENSSLSPTQMTQIIQQQHQQSIQEQPSTPVMGVQQLDETPFAVHYEQSQVCDQCPGQSSRSSESISANPSDRLSSDDENTMQTSTSCSISPTVLSEDQQKDETGEQIFEQTLPTATQLASPVALDDLNADSRSELAPLFGPVSRSRPKPMDKVFVKVKTHGPWESGVVQELVEKPDKSVEYKVIVHSDQAVVVTGRQVAYENETVYMNISSLPIRVIVRRRTVHLGDENCCIHNNHKLCVPKFFSGLIMEKLEDERNKNQFLILFDDDESARYVRRNDVRLLCECWENDLDDVDEIHRDSIKNYFEKLHSNTFAKVCPGDMVMVKANGNFFQAKVREVDCSIVKVRFDDKSTKWILRSAIIGSSAKKTHSTSAASTGISETSQNNSRNFRRPPLAPIRVGSRTKNTHHAANWPLPKVFVPHECGPRCVQRIPFCSEMLYCGNPLAIPLKLGWRRILSHSHGGKVCEVAYLAPCGRRIRHMTDVRRYLFAVESEMTVDMFNWNQSVDLMGKYVYDEKRVLIKDLSNGAEKVPISVFNDIDDSVPEPFRYSTAYSVRSEKILFRDMKFFIGCECVDDCIDQVNCSCWQMTREPRPSRKKGYQYRRLLSRVYTGIYECNERCKCSSRCLNRVVQNPLQLELQVFKTLDRGWGVRCLYDIPAGTFICDYAGEILSDKEAEEAGSQTGDTYFVNLDFNTVALREKEGYESGAEEDEAEPEDEEEDKMKDINFSPFIRGGRDMLSPKYLRRRPRQSLVSTPSTPYRDSNQPEEDYYVVDAKFKGNVARFFNHSCNPNVFAQNVFVDTHDIQFHRIALFAWKRIPAGTELTWDYGYKRGQVQGKVMKCNCKSSCCRGRLL